MNPGIGMPEIAVLLLLALIVVGPAELPKMMRTIGRFVNQARSMAKDFQRSFDEMGRESELADLRKEIENLKSANPVGEISEELRKAKEDLRHAEAVGSKEKAVKPAAKPVADLVPDDGNTIAPPREKPKPAQPIKTGAPEDE
ncbi:MULTISPECIES: Sec-independent protein translocase protein TatB [Hyphobacterium]|uniref:Sec-independent protein translocase protein TatB n=1 Tax=Hyphobacterium vulgare TaxID=1736751 RepID=A0ABV6ZUL4_9PROT